MPSNQGKASVCGTIQFKNGKIISFSSDQEDHDILHQRLTLVCQQIAKFYGTKVIRGKNGIAASENQTPVLLKEILMLFN